MTKQERTMQTARKSRTPGSSRGRRSLTTLLAQMADLERGARIRELRQAKHLTQPAVAELVGVSLRAYQAWEGGGGIAWDNVKLLAETLDADADFILSGPRSTSNGDAAPTQLDRIERLLTEVLDLLRAQGPPTTRPRDPGAELEAEMEEEVQQARKRARDIGEGVPGRRAAQ